MKFKVVFTLLFLLSSSVVIADNQSKGLGFVAPEISGIEYITNPVNGEIVFDSSRSQFYGRNSTEWIRLGSNSLDGEIIRRAQITCSSASSVNSQSGAWITAVGNRSNGACSVTIASGVFGSGPTCTANQQGTSLTSFLGVKFNSVSSTGFTILGVEQSLGTTAATVNDVTYNVICMGPES